MSQPPLVPAVAHAERARVELVLSRSLSEATERMYGIGDDRTPLGELAGWWTTLIDDEIMPAVIEAYGEAPGLVDFLVDTRHLLLAVDVPSQVFAARHPELM